MKKIAVAVFALLLFCALPIVDQSTISAPADQIAYDVCWSRFGVSFPQRWSCETTIKGNMVAILFACAFKRDDIRDICDRIDKSKAADLRPAAADDSFEENCIRQKLCGD